MFMHLINEIPVQCGHFVEILPYSLSSISLKSTLFRQLMIVEYTAAIYA